MIKAVFQGKNVDKAIQAFKHCQCVFFDVDSTIIKQEGLDELARHLGKYEEICALTNKAMEGHMSYVQAFEARLNMLNPTKDQLDSFMKHWTFEFTDGIQQLIQNLLDDKKDVYLVSGGIYDLLVPIAQELSVELSHVFCNRIQFNGNSYAGFDGTLPINQPEGKISIIRSIIKQKGYEHCIMIGDGVTDLETKSVVDAFIGYGGVRQRPVVVENADLFITSFSALLSIYFCLFQISNH